MSYHHKGHEDHSANSIDFTNLFSVHSVVFAVDKHYIGPLRFFRVFRFARP